MGSFLLHIHDSHCRMLGVDVSKSLDDSVIFTSFSFLQILLVIYIYAIYFNHKYFDFLFKTIIGLDFFNIFVHVPSTFEDL
eukprot:c30091_g1_i1 orf=1-240(-)